MEEPKVFTPSQVSEHNTKGDCWIWIGGKVYDVTNFLEEHPGGEEVILEVAGRDATKDFEDVGHSEAAKEMMNTYLVGVLEGYKLENVSIQKKEASVKREKEKTAFKEVPTSTVKNEEPSTLIKLLQFLVPLLIVGVAFGIRSFFKEAQPSS